MLQVNNLTVTQNRDQRTLISDLSFSLLKGDKLAVIGAEGNGKTALLRIICEPELASAYLSWQGHIDYAPYHIGYLAQETPPHLYDKTVEVLTRPYISDGDLYRFADELMLREDILFSRRTIESLSGGERMKLRLLLVRLKRPDIFVLDEPINDLDLEGIQLVEAFIADCPEPVLFVSHDETLLDRTANKILHIEQIWRRTEARATYSGLGFSEYMIKFVYDIERQNRIAAKEEKDFRNKMRRHLEIQDKVHRAQENISRRDPSGARLLKKKMHAVKSTGRRLERERNEGTKRTDREDDVDFFLADMPHVPNGKEVIRVNLPFLTIGETILSRNVQLLVKGPERIAITGENGCGKSTLLRLMVEELRERNDLQLFYLPQEWHELFDTGSNAIDYLASDGRAGLKQEAANLLGSLNFAREEMLRPIETLSGGQKVKLAFAKMRLTRPDVLLLDEPSRHLSPLSNPAFRESVATYPGCVISISHDRAFLREVCTRVLRLTKDGLREEDRRLYADDDSD
jgi:ATPase subunit of ABC transporter with duplicated ATPase domains